MGLNSARVSIPVKIFNERLEWERISFRSFKAFGRCKFDESQFLERIQVPVRPRAQKHSARHVVLPKRSQSAIEAITQSEVLSSRGRREPIRTCAGNNDVEGLHR